MKKILCFFSFLSLYSYSYSQTNDYFFEATYSFTPQQNRDGNEKDKLLKSLLFNNLKYNVRSNGQSYELSATGIDVNADHVHTKTSGPATIHLNLTNNYIQYDSDTMQYFTYRKIDFKQAKGDTVLNGYSCKLLVTKNSDSVYISPQLPYYVNPFMLTGTEIKYGIVKAVLKSSGSYTLETINKRKGVPVASAVFINPKKVELSDNNFF